MKVRSAIRAMCKSCYIVRRGKKLCVYCKENPKHKQRQGFHTLASASPEESLYCCPCGEDHGVFSHLTAAAPEIPVASVPTSRFNPQIGVVTMLWK